MAGTLRITNLVFKSGPIPGAPPLEIRPTTVVIFVGPNNSGKSLALREIEAWCFNQDIENKVIHTIDVDFPETADAAEALVRQFEASPPPGQAAQPGYLWIGQHTFRPAEPVRQFNLELSGFRRAVENRDRRYLRSYLSSAYTARLDGRTRFTLSDPKATGDLQLPAQNHLWALFKDDAARERVREMTADAFGLHFVIDATGMQSFRIRMSPRAPLNTIEEQALDATARRFHSQAQQINELSDGVQAFVGLVSAVMSLAHRILLIDEPDAFLHPPLARRLGGSLARIARDRSASLIVATHSSAFLLGCLEAISETSIVRLTYESGIATARALSASELAAMTGDPLLRSTGVFEALFHRSAIVTESDTDRAFYAEINRRLQMANRGLADAIFLNAQNKQTVRRVVAPLRRIGIPAVALVDLDAIKEGGTPWEDLLSACQVPTADRPHLEAERAYLKDAFAGLPRDRGHERIKTGGVQALSGSDRPRAESLLEKLCSYGLFLVPKGELESWLQNLGAQGHGADWLLEIFIRLGGDERTPAFVRPGTNDVWRFLDQIAQWVANPNRLGTN